MEASAAAALLCWARDAHWSMGGLGAKHLRLQGRIEGNLVKLRRTARRDARVTAKSAKAKVRAVGHRPAPATLDDALGSASLKRKAVAPAAGTAARTSPKRKAAEARAARRTSPRSKH